MKDWKFQGLIIWKISFRDEIIITQPSWNFISPLKFQLTLGWNLHPEIKHHFSPHNRNFSFIPGWKQKIPLIQKIIFIKTKMATNPRVSESSSSEENKRFRRVVNDNDEKLVNLIKCITTKQLWSLTTEILTQIK